MLTSTITVQTDHGPVELPLGSTLADLLRQWPGLRSEGVATAVNGSFVARAQRESHALQHGDTVLCFAPITGG